MQDAEALILPGVAGEERQHEVAGAVAPDQQAARLLALAADLAAPREAIDGAFVAVGNHLSECASVLLRVTDTFEALPNDLGGEDLAEATSRLSIVGSRAGEISVALGSERDDLQGLVSALRRAAHPIAELRKTVKMMGIVAINARVVAASVVTELEDFGVFTTDIAELSGGAATTIQRFSRTYEALTTVVGEAAEARGNFEAAHRDTLAALATELERNLAEVTEQRLESVRSSAATGQMSRAITDKVATTVMALQVGDATRQRVEHVEAALQDVSALILPRVAGEGDHAEHGGGGVDPAVQAPDLTAPVVELQRRQLAAARESLVDEMASGADALTRLSHDVQAVLDHARAVYGSAENRSALSELHSAVRRAVVVLRDCEREREKLDRVAAAVSETVGVLLNHVEAVQEIEYKMRLVSLNAAVKCAQLGPRGRALDVIAQQLRTLTGETVVSAQAAVQCLNDAARFSAAFTQSAGSGATSVGDLEREATAALEQLETVGFRMKKALVELYDDGPTVAAHLEDAVGALANHAAISEALSDIEFSLAGLGEQGGGAAADFSAEPAASFFATLRRRYTMDAERRLLDTFTGIPVEPEPEPEPASDSADALDDLFF
ncbi:hypothetical protein PRN20_05120 [Devosia sp. ZB163]|uniref:hypothetical protein n=1 Tax=Devosia sp. ZB163 TaxID=3025938 RepID=UPI002361CF12|nr:hypothetical protein [Devosia sp. ZB163]MDC9823106.1 hypothetical protein [Devosia sp. ZB163]